MKILFSPAPTSIAKPMRSHSYFLYLGMTIELLLGGLMSQTAQAQLPNAPLPGMPTAPMPGMPVPGTPPMLSPPPAPAPEKAVDKTPAPTLELAPGKTLERALDKTPGMTTPATGGLQILSPVAETILDVPAATAIIQYPLGATLVLSINGTQVDIANIGRTETDSENKLITQTWYGLPLAEGTNRLTVTTLINGQVTATATREIQVRGDVKTLKVESLETRLPADGKSQATVRGELLDAQGNRANREAIITLITNGGEFVGVDEDPNQPGFQVRAKAGQFTAQLKSGLTGQTVSIRAISGTLNAYNQLSFETNLRPSIATGFVDIRLGQRGTDFYQSLRNYLPTDEDYGTRLGVKGAAFATGKVGEWLFTGAFNSDRPLNRTCDGGNRLFRTIQECEQQYPTYGDNSQSTIVAPSTDQLYVRFERNSPTPRAGVDYAMWGDYNTEEFASKSQEFTAMTRQLHGLKLNYNVGNLQLTGLFANNLQGFQRDTIAPDGTSGYYFLSQRLLVEGSENVFVELEELNRPGTVLSRQQLQRGPDYEIDYGRGTLLFRSPVLRTDIGPGGETLVRRVVTTYQYETPGQSDNYMYGGRARYHLSRRQNQESWLAGTYLRENHGSRDFELYGLDGQMALGTKGAVIGEYAHSSNLSELLGVVDGSAYRVELTGQPWNGLEGRAFYRKTGEGFANNATTSFVPGQTRYGVQANLKLGKQTQLRAQYDHEANTGIAPRPLNTTFDLFAPRQEALPGTKQDNALTTVSLGLQQQIGASALTVDWLHRDRTDRITDRNSSNSDQLRSRLTVPIAKNLSFLAQNETTLSVENDAFYPDRTLLGLNWNVVPGINLQLAQQFFTKGNNSGNSITSLNLSGDYNLWSEAKISGRYTLFTNPDGWKGNGALGLKQGIKISPGLRADIAYEHLFGDSLGLTPAGTQFLQPFAPGQSGASLGVQGGDSYSFGLEYNDSPSFQAMARYEHRSSTAGSNTVISANAKGKLSPAITALLRYQQASSANQTIQGLGTTSHLKMGLAYRNPKNDRFNGLIRYEYRKNPSILPSSILYSSGTGSSEHLFALEGIYSPNWQWEFYGKAAMRSGRTYLADDLVGTNTVGLIQARAVYRFHQNWDLTGEARWIGQSTTGYSEWGAVLEAGYYLNPNLRLYAGYTLGRVGDRDFDSGRGSSGPYLGIAVKVNELFHGFGLQKAPARTAPVTQQIVPVVPPEAPPEAPPVQTLPIQTSNPMILSPSDPLSPPIPTPPPQQRKNPKVLPQLGFKF
jgi:hypothetical protein